MGGRFQRGVFTPKEHEGLYEKAVLQTEGKNVGGPESLGPGHRAAGGDGPAGSKRMGARLLPQLSGAHQR